MPNQISPDEGGEAAVSLSPWRCTHVRKQHLNHEEHEEEKSAAAGRTQVKSCTQTNTLLSNDSMTGSNPPQQILKDRLSVFNLLLMNFFRRGAGFNKERGDSKSYCCVETFSISSHT